MTATYAHCGGAMLSLNVRTKLRKVREKNNRYIDMMNNKLTMRR